MGHILSLIAKRSQYNLKYLAQAKSLTHYNSFLKATENPKFLDKLSLNLTNKSFTTQIKCCHLLSLIRLTKNSVHSSKNNVKFTNMSKLNASQLRISCPSTDDLAQIKRTPIYLVMDRIIDTYNIGSLFRLADATACKKVYLCGDMEYPPSSRIHKAAVGTENWVPWEKKNSTVEVVERLKKRGVQIIAVEQSKNSISYKDLTPDMIHFPVAIIAGNETYGIEDKVLEKSDIVVELPMLGINKSFNVWGATAVIAYKILEYLKT